MGIGFRKMNLVNSQSRHSGPRLENWKRLLLLWGGLLVIPVPLFETLAVAGEREFQYFDQSHTSTESQNPSTLQEQVVIPLEIVAAGTTSLVGELKADKAVRSVVDEALSEEILRSEQARSIYKEVEKEYKPVAGKYEDLMSKYRKAVQGNVSYYNISEYKLGQNVAHGGKLEFHLLNEQKSLRIPPNRSEAARIKPLLKAEAKKILPQIKRHQEALNDWNAASVKLSSASEALLTNNGRHPLSKQVRSRLLKIGSARLLAHGLGVLGVIDVIRRVNRINGELSEVDRSTHGKTFVYNGQTAEESVFSNAKESDSLSSSALPGS